MRYYTRLASAYCDSVISRQYTVCMLDNIYICSLWLCALADWLCDSIASDCDAGGRQNAHAHVDMLASSAAHAAWLTTPSLRRAPTRDTSARAQHETASTTTSSLIPPAATPPAASAPAAPSQPVTSVNAPLPAPDGTGMQGGAAAVGPSSDCSNATAALSCTGTAEPAVRSTPTSCARSQSYA